LKNIRNILTIYTFGSIFYSLIEIYTRGFTHWTMVISGGFTFVIIYLTSIKLSNKPYSLQITVYTLIITAVEFTLGFVLNTVLKMDIWSYADKPYNLLGYICLYNCLLWLLLSMPCALFCSFFRKLFRQP
jgi:uncharacterized membrane protein